MSSAEANQAFVRDLYRRRYPLHAMATELAVLAAILRAASRKPCCTESRLT